MTKVSISNKEAQSRLNHGKRAYILDARPEDVYTGGSDQIEGAIHLPEVMLHEVYMQLPKDKEYLIYTTKGEEEISEKMAKFLVDKGYFACSINGGYEDWRDSGLPIEPIKAKGTPILNEDEFFNFEK